MPHCSKSTQFHRKVPKLTSTVHFCESVNSTTVALRCVPGLDHLNKSDYFQDPGAPPTDAAQKG